MIRSPMEYVPPKLRPFAGYFVAGGFTTGLAFGMLAIFVEYGGWDETLSFAVCYVIASVVQYLLLYYWAFGSTAGHGQASVRFLVTSLAMLGLKSEPSGSSLKLYRFGTCWRRSSSRHSALSAPISSASCSFLPGIDEGGVTIRRNAARFRTSWNREADHANLSNIAAVVVCARSGFHPLENMLD